MSPITPAGATLPGVTHHLADVNGTRLHYVRAGTTGSPILLVHGWPETWWAFRKLIPLLAETHQVFALDLRGFGDSSNDDTEYGEEVTAEDLHQLVRHIGSGPVHLLCQDISGGASFRFAALHPEDVISFTGVETTVAGFGFEAFTDVSNGGSWHVGFLAAPGIPDMLLRGHEREFLTGWAFPMMNGTEGAITERDVDEFVRTYGRPNGWRGTQAIYHSLVSGQEATRALAASHPLTVPVLTVDTGHPATENTFRRLSAGEVTAVRLPGVGHLVAQESPDALAAAVLEFTRKIDES
ncbi:alpha/beta fold hydrolase [Streptomyces apricus]|uniref:Alpha/beta hydrolase n=1 Tax=Streptomyces apricus TaxID=1828112 RepID=A0A5B0BFX8_9ACTN|nr:alpha/beta hydrolase [Streptomyces apricus]KAA0940516.1 alpha/beta hydrolase [Streptomyces apricus]